METFTQARRKPWVVCGAMSGLSLALALGLHGAADAAAPSFSSQLPPELARSLAAHPREARTQLPDGAWLVLERDGRALKLVEDRVDGRVLRRWPLGSPRRYASLSLLPGGRALLWGGVDASNRLQAGGLWFDPASRTLTPAYEVPLSPRAGHAASVLSDGRLLVTGGWTPDGAAGARAELWDERSERAASAAQASARLGHRSRVEADGRVRLFEGVDAQGRALARDQVYDPAQRAFAAAAVSPASTAASPKAPAPVLSGSTPRHQARDVAADARMSLRFSQPLRANELNAANVTLLGPRGYAPVQITPAEAGRLLFVTPRQRLQADTEYSLLVDGVHARDGQMLAPTLIDFATAAASANTPATDHAPSPRAANQAPSAPARASRTPATLSLAAPAAATTPRTTTAALTIPDLAVDGASLSAQTLAIGEPSQFRFTIAQTGDYGLGLSALTTPGSSAAATLTVQRSGSAPITLSCLAANDGCGANLAALPTGTYTATLTPPPGARLGYTATLSRDLTGTFSLGRASAVGLSRPGRNARMSFTLGGASHLRINTQTTQPAGREVAYTLYAPNGSVAQTFSAVARGMIDLNTTAGGRYTLLVDPRYGEALTGSLTVASGAASPLQADAAVRDYVSAAGQPVSIPFEIADAEPLGLGIGNLVVSGSTQPASLQIQNHNGQPMRPAETCLPANGGCDANLSGLAPGLYSALLVPPSAATASFSAALSHDRVVELAAGADSELTLDRFGRNGRLAFDVGADQALALNVSQVATVPALRPIGYSLLAADGSAQFKGSVSGAKQWVLTGLPAGRYYWQVDPLQGETATLRASLQEAAGSTAIGADPIALSTQTSGERASFSFANSRTRDVGIGIAELDLTGTANYANVSVSNQDGATVSTVQCYDDLDRRGCELDLPGLAPGLYTVTIAPGNGNGLTRLSAAVSEDIVATLQPGQPLDLAIARLGQNAQFDFTAQAGETVNLGVSAQLTQPAGRFVGYTVYGPTGNEIVFNSVGANGTGGVSLENLVAGRHLVRVDPGYGATMTAQVNMLPPLSGELIADGAPHSFAPAIGNQTVTLNFQAQAGARLGLGLDQFAQVTYPFAVRVYKPDGSLLAAQQCDRSALSCALDLPQLDAGAYAIKIDPPDNQSLPFSMRATLSSDLELPLALDQPDTLQLDRWGRNARYRFHAEPGQDLTLAVADVHRTDVPAQLGPTRYIDYVVRDPNGQVVRTAASAEGQAFRLNDLSVAGDYTLSISPRYGDTLSAQVWLGRNDIAGDVIADGDPQVYQASAPGAPLSFGFGFDAAPGARLRLGIGPAAEPLGSVFSLRIEREGAGTVSTVACTSGGCKFALDDAPGRYRATVFQSAGQTPYRANVRAALSSVRTGALVLGETQTVTLRSGQDAELDFHGDAGQRLTFSISDQASDPAGRMVYYFVRNPDGSLLTSRGVSGAAMNFDLPALPVAGDYRVEMSSKDWPGVGATLRLDPTP